MNILQINGSARSQGANSTRLATDIVARLRAVPRVKDAASLDVAAEAAKAATAWLK